MLFIALLLLSVVESVRFSVTGGNWPFPLWSLELSTSPWQQTASSICPVQSSILLYNGQTSVFGNGTEFSMPFVTPTGNFSVGIILFYSSPSSYLYIGTLKGGIGFDIYACQSNLLTDASNCLYLGSEPIYYGTGALSVTLGNDGGLTVKAGQPTQQFITSSPNLFGWSHLLPPCGKVGVAAQVFPGIPTACVSSATFSSTDYLNIPASQGPANGGTPVLFVRSTFPQCGFYSALTASCTLSQSSGFTTTFPATLTADNSLQCLVPNIGFSETYTFSIEQYGEPFVDIYDRTSFPFSTVAIATNISANSVPGQGLTTLTIYGAGFKDIPSFFTSAYEANFIGPSVESAGPFPCDYQSAATLTVTLPTLVNAGMANLTITGGELGPNAVVGVVPMTFTFGVTNYVPKQDFSIGGSTIDVFGFGFDPTFNSSYACVFTEAGSTTMTVPAVLRNSTNLRCTSPNWGFVNPASAVSFFIQGPLINTSYAQASFTFLEIWQSLTPTTGLASGGDTVYIMGSGFNTASTYICMFANNSASQQAPSAAATVINSTAISCVTPPWGDSYAAGVVAFLVDDQTLQNPIFFLGGSDNTTTLPFVFTVNWKSAFPTSSALEGGTVVTVKGSGFNPRSRYLCHFRGNFSDVHGKPFYELISNATFPRVFQLICVVPKCDCATSFESTLVVTMENDSVAIHGPSDFSFSIGPPLPPVQPVEPSTKPFPLVAVVAGACSGLVVIGGIMALLVYRARNGRRGSLEINMHLLDATQTGRTDVSDGAPTRKHPMPFGFFSKSPPRKVATKKTGDLILFSSGDISLHERIGYGSSGMVYRASWQGMSVAVKIVTCMDDRQRLEFEEEAMLLSSLRHPNVVQLLGIMQDLNTAKEKLSMVTEYLPGGSLFDLLHKSDMFLSQLRRIAMALDTSRGMHFLHSRTPAIMHRDLKSPNLLVGHDFTIKICDFGLSKLIKPENTHMTSCGTPSWVAPEILNDERYTEKADVWSFGVVCWELVTRMTPYGETTAWQVAIQVAQNGAAGLFSPTYSPMFDQWNPRFVELFKSCLTRNPEERPKFECLLEAITAIILEYEQSPQEKPL